MTPITFTSPRTSRVYLHGPFARRLILLFPDFKICNLQLSYNRHLDLPGFAVTLLDGEPGEADQLEYDKTAFDDVRGGDPCYTIRNTLKTGAAIAMTAFAVPDDEDPNTFFEIRLTNPLNYDISGALTVFPRTADIDHYITNLRDTGYDPYIPNVKTQYMLPPTWKPDGLAAASDGYGSLALDAPGLGVEWISRREQPKHFAASDCFAVRYALAPGESRVFTAVCRHGAIKPGGYSDSLGRFYDFWSKIMDKVKVRPNTTAPRVQAMFSQMIVQSMQMLARYDDFGDAVLPRQGDVGRYCWSWEAPHYLLPLDRVGLSEYTTDAFRTLLERWQNTDEQSPDYGRCMSPNVHWDNSTGMTLAGVARHLIYTRDKALYKEFRPYIMRAFDWVERKRKSTIGKEGVVQGLFPEGRASDWGEIGQHWTFTDAVNVYGYNWLYKCLDRFVDPDAPRVKAAYDEYYAAVRGQLESERKGHEKDVAFYPSHITGHKLEDMLRHCYYTDGAPYLYLCGIIDENDPVIGQMWEYMKLHGLIDHGLVGRLTNNADLTNYDYGDVYYTGVAEVMWIYPFLKAGKTKLAKELFDAVMKYNITREYITSERYCSRDEWYSPWSPNASANGRIIELLLEWYK